MGNSGFSAVEVVVALVILAVLGMLVNSRYNHYIAKARQAEAKNNLELIASLQETYLLEHGKYIFLEPVGLNRGGGPPTHHCRTDQPGSGMLNELGFRPKNCEELRYNYWTPEDRRGELNQNPPRYTVRADSVPTKTGVYIWPDCKSRDMWRVQRTAGQTNYAVVQPSDNEFENTGAQRRALENCK